MADLTLTAANVVAVAGTDPNREIGIAGETIVAGQVLALDTTVNKLVKADSNSATPALRKARGIAMNSASLNQPVAIQRGGDITIGGTLVANTPYYLSDTPGGICPLADVGTGEYLTQIGIAKSVTVLAIDIQATGVAN